MWGYLWFADLGPYYVHGRWYPPDVGRFIEPDDKNVWQVARGVASDPRSHSCDLEIVMHEDIWKSPLLTLALAAILPCSISILGMFVCFGLLADADRRNIELSHKQGTLRFEPAEIQPALAWREADFMRAARVLLESAGDKPFVSSGFYEVSFSTTCTNTQDGPQEMTFSYLNRAPFTRSGKPYEVGSITVYRSGRIEWIESQMADVHQERTAVKREGPADSADVALAIAERAGGASFRSRHFDQCHITGILADSVNNEEWGIQYESDNDPVQFLVVNVDRKTGKSNVVSTPVP